MRGPLIAAVCGTAVLIACSNPDPEDGAPGCTAGDEAACTCEGGRRGTAVCGDDGVLGVCACDGEGGSGGTGGGGEGGSGGAAGPGHRWVTNAIAFPEIDGGLAGFDFDEDGRNDNRLGEMWVLLAQASDHVPADDAVIAGRFVQLHELRAGSLEEASAATWEVYEGEAVETPDFTGEGAFTAVASTGSVRGAIALGTFRGEGGPVNLALPVFGVDAALRIEAVRIEAVVAETGCSGVAGGGVAPVGFAEAIVTALDRAIAAEDCVPDGPCSDGIETFLRFYDRDQDRHVTADELAGNPLWTSFVSPDVDTDGDAVADGVSIGWGFTCVGAGFTPPGG